MSQRNKGKQSLIPVVIMTGFTLLLLGALAFRADQADKDLGMIRISERQARLAAEAGVQFALDKIIDIVKQSERLSAPLNISPAIFDSEMDIDEWKSFGLKTSAFFRIIGVRKLSNVDEKDTSLIDEGQRYQILTEGRSGRNRYSVAAVIQLYDLTHLFSAFNSLNEYYYGKPVQPWIEASGSLENFKNANKDLFDSGKIDSMGVCNDPGLIYRIFVPGGNDPFKHAAGAQSFGQNFSRNYSRKGDSPAKGPVYCTTPMILDSHNFWAPFQTASYIYRRNGSKPRISMGTSVFAVNSSLRLQQSADSLEGGNPTNVTIDRDSAYYKSFIPEWRPDIDFLRDLAKKKGVYIDENGIGHSGNSSIEIDYHPETVKLFSDSYKRSNSVQYEQDELEANCVTLSSDAKFDGFNNISSKNLQGSRIIFSERSIFLRGDIGNDLIIVTPGHIFLTGPTNVDSNLNLFLIAEQGVAIHTGDFEKTLSQMGNDSAFVEAARHWIINAVIYKPGAGFYTSKALKQDKKVINFRRAFNGKSLKLTLNGSCIEGNLQRWMDNSEENGVNLFWKPEAADRLYLRPISANVLRLRSQPDK